jgi:hypothetical protein
MIFGSKIMNVIYSNILRSGMRARKTATRFSSSCSGDPVLAFASATAAVLANVGI